MERPAVKQERAFPNTFAPACGNRELRVSEIIAGLGFGVFKYRALPPKVRKAVDEEMDRRRERKPEPWAVQSKRRAEMLATARELVRHSSEKGAPVLVGTRAHKKGSTTGREKLGSSDTTAPTA